MDKKLQPTNSPTNSQLKNISISDKTHFLPALQSTCLHLFKNRFAFLLVDFPQMDCVLFPIITNTDDTSLQTTGKRETTCEPTARYKYVKGNL